MDVILVLTLEVPELTLPAPGTTFVILITMVSPARPEVDGPSNVALRESASMVCEPVNVPAW